MCSCGIYSETLCSARGQVQLHGMSLICSSGPTQAQEKHLRYVRL